MSELVFIHKMIFISHRGNLNGKEINLENSPNYIDNALNQKFDVELDIFLENEKFYLGHDEPQYLIDISWLNKRKNNLWIHCKNIPAMVYFNMLKKKYHYFWHENDTLTLTSKNYIWCFPNKQPTNNSIAVMPEIHQDDIEKCVGICSDYIDKYFKSLNGKL